MDYYWLCPLYSFTCDSESIKLNEYTNIILAPAELKKIVREQLPKRAGLDLDNPDDFQWALQLSHSQHNTTKQKIDIMDIVGYIHWFLHFFVWSLRLHKKGCVTPGPVHQLQNNNGEILKYSTFNSTLCRNGFSKQPTYELNKNDIPNIKNILSIFNSRYSKAISSQLKIALDRFDAAYYETIEDSLIDQMIAFESLFLGDEQELNYKLAMRAAFFLEKDEEKRNVTFSNIKKAYNLRSKIVHGSEQFNHEKLEIIIPLTEEYLRQSIKKFLFLFSKEYTLDVKRGKKDILVKLDKNILTNGQTLTIS